MNPTEELYTLVVDGEVATTGLLLHVAQKAVSEWSRVSPDAHVEYRPDTPPTQIVDLLKHMSFLDVAGVIHTATEALRHSCGFARYYADLGVNITLLHSHEEDCDWMREDIVDIKNTKELVNLITMASFRLQTLSR